MSEVLVDSVIVFVIGLGVVLGSVFLPIDSTTRYPTLAVDSVFEVILVGMEGMELVV
jgi:hypothetical protein